MSGGDDNMDNDGARKRHYYGHSGSSKRASSSDETRRLGRGLSRNISGGDGLGDRNALKMPGATDEGRAPEGIICQLSKRVAKDPVRTPYGHVRTWRYEVFVLFMRIAIVILKNILLHSFTRESPFMPSPLPRPNLSRADIRSAVRSANDLAMAF